MCLRCVAYSTAHAAAYAAIGAKIRAAATWRRAMAIPRAAWAGPESTPAARPSRGRAQRRQVRGCQLEIVAFARQVDPARDARAERGLQAARARHRHHLVAAGDDER